ncbi:MAG: hypothetical protein ACEY3D_00325 [Rickettsia sp.]|uniref:hypothetical protein n=1 Tax=Rickettsia sp. TaxID=789 RepID=UPI00397B7D5B
MLKEIGKINKKLDEAARDIGQEANKLVGTEISQALKPNASRHKEALKDAQAKLKGDNNQQDNTELTGATPEEHHEN